VQEQHRVAVARDQLHLLADDQLVVLVGEDAVFGVRFTDRRPLRTWMDLTTADKDLGYRWAIELMKRGLVVNPNEKFYISIAHSDADVDRTLGIVDDAFSALRKSR